ncbi:alginate O-acetyltransferase AlgX-related protein [Enterobacter cancerogenus]|uniref:alginate O-acetyltransferase AlgX-related protein n=1 Tax=Enterobacter cancerogenus TaxID=69218 RepID=UPI0005375779|nr:hypothetical protein [Enterobacter cancerogenus]KGT90753.1 hypothetical protein NH00_10340 [Enterobacter cancerogenus]
MKTKSLIFILLFALSVLALPFYRAYEGTSFYKEGSLSDSLKSAYNIDPILSVFGSIGNLFGISVDPRRVYQGKDGWLFLGNDFNQTLAKKINGAASYEPQIQETNNSIQSWSEFLDSIGCKRFYVVIGPDKESIYPEKMPDWFHPNPNGIPQRLISLNKDIYVDTFSEMKSKKNSITAPMYFKTDTHWNELGASIAFNALKNKSIAQNDGLIWPNDKLEFAQSPRNPGDLSNFQRSGTFLSDSDFSIKNQSITKLKITEEQFSSGKILYHGENKQIQPPQENLLIKSPNALNNKRVIWLRDSFGTAMSRLMAVTFSETLQIHLARTSPEEIKKIISDFKPDYVIATVVERDSTSRLFQYNVYKSN